MTFEGFVFSEETGALSDAEYQHARELLDAVARSITIRDELIENDPSRAAVIAADEGWHPNSQPSFELDGSTKNAQTSYQLLATLDRDILRKMRLYSQAYTGYQLATLSLAAQRPWVSAKLPENLDDFLRLCAGPPDEWVFNYVATAGALPENLRAAPPHRFGEIGWLMDGVIINYDTFSYLERLCLMHENGILDHLREKSANGKTLQIVEIGGGYGGLAYQLMNIFDESLRYAIIDLPESLAFSSIYCDTLFPDLENEFVDTTGPHELSSTPGFSYLPNSICHELASPAGDADLVINTLSLSEMSDSQIENYCGIVGKLIGSTGLFFEQNHQENHEGPGGIPVRHFKNIRACETNLLPAGFEARRGQANIWVNPHYGG